jgi:hypothetical protein
MFLVVSCHKGDLMKIPVLVFCLLICSTAVVSAQTAGEMDTVLETGEVSVILAARFVLGALNMIPGGVSGSEAERDAYAMALERGWVKGSPLALITLRELSFLVMNACGIKGGIGYSLTHSPRYAYRELRYRKIIQGRADPSMTVSGTRLLQIIDRAIVYSAVNDTVEAGPEAGGVRLEGMVR